jgi:hypothetical protein
VWFHSRLFLGVGCGVEVLLEQVQLNFNFRNKFIILLPCGLLVDNSILSKLCVFEVLLATLIMVVMKTEMCIFNNNKIKVMKSLCWLF